MLNFSSDNILEMEGNPTRPSVFFNKETGILRLKGRSVLENTMRFYEPVMEWLDNYTKNPPAKTQLHLELEYFNTSTSKYILLILELLIKIHEEGSEVIVIWYYSDEDMLELGTDYQQMLPLPFEFRKLEME
jgi:hypothetical protein